MIACDSRVVRRNVGRHCANTRCTHDARSNRLPLMLSHAKVIPLSCTVILLYDTMATLGRRSVSGGA